MTIFRQTLGGLLGLALTFAAHGAAATAISKVDGNVLYVYPTYGFTNGTYYGSSLNPMDGISVALVSQTISSTVTTSGNASVSFKAPLVSFDPEANYLRTRIGGSATANPDGYAFGTYSLVVTLAFTNLSGIDLDQLIIRKWYSGFDHSGDPFGAHVSDAALEFARFSSTSAGDGHSCDTRLPPGSNNPTFPTTPPAVACGVFSPDLSDTELVLSDLDDGETKTWTFTQTFTLEAKSIPEPTGLAVFAAALAVCMSYRRFARSA